MKQAILLGSHEHKKLCRLAKKAHVSIEEINRRAIAAYEPYSMQTLELLADVVLQSSAAIEKSLDKTHKEVQAIITSLHQSNQRSLHGIRQQDI
jgi:hypothetical protein